MTQDTKQCTACCSRKSSPSPVDDARIAARKMNADLASENAALKAEQQAILDDIYHQKAEARRMAEQAEERLRLNFERSA